MFSTEAVLSLLSENPVWKITIIVITYELTFPSLYFLVILAPFRNTSVFLFKFFFFFNTKEGHEHICPIPTAEFFKTYKTPYKVYNRKY